jgi:hypothetical protein
MFLSKVEMATLPGAGVPLVASARVGKMSTPDWITALFACALATISYPAGFSPGPKTEIFCAPLFSRIDFI